MNFCLERELLRELLNFWLEGELLREAFELLVGGGAVEGNC